MGALKQPRNYFVFNKESDFQRGWRHNLTCRGAYVQAENCGRSGVFYSRLLDSRSKQTTWHRMTMDSHSLGDASVRFSFYCSESPTVLWQGAERDLEQLLRDPALTDDDRASFSAPYLVKTALNPRDVLLQEITGRYLWFRAELRPQGGESPVVGRIKIYLPRETWLQYLPEVYQEDPGGESFTARFLGIFQSLYDDLEADIRNVARYFDPDVVAGEYLEWLAGWLDVEDSYLWPEDKLRKLVKNGMALYQIRGTRQYVAAMVRLYTGEEPYIVEYSQVEPFLGDVGKTALLQELYGDNPYRITLILSATALRSNEEYKALLRIVDNARPAWTEVNLVVLKPYIFLNKYTYLGMNSSLDRYRPLNLDGYSALPFTSLGNGAGREINAEGADEREES